MKIGRSVLIAFLLLLFPLFSYSSDDWKTYPYTHPDSEAVFPDDEGSHRILFPTGLEWWYVVIHAVGETTGDKYSILVTHFNNEFRFFTVTNVTRETHKSGTTMGLLNSKKGYLDLTQTTVYGTDYMKCKKDEDGELIPFEYEFETFHSEMHLKGEFTSLKPPMLVGGSGYVPIGSSGYSWYYSLTRMDVNAVLTYNGITENIKGLGWMDHQWGNFLISPVELYGVFETYEWFCLQLDNGSEVMISNIFNRDYDLPYGEKYGGIQYNGPDGVTIPDLESKFTRAGYWRDPTSGNYMSMGWELEVPQIDLKLILTPEFKDQMVDFPLNGDFWEGSIAVTGALDNVPVSGRGFGELMHRYEIPRLSVTADNYPLKTTYEADETIEVEWLVKNPDDGNPLTYDVELVAENLAIPIAQGIKANRIEFTLEETVPEGSKIDAFRIRVTASSVDRVIQGSAYSPYLWIDGWWTLFDDDGVVQPASYHQRYRRAEFDADKPFYQWWYYAIKDHASNRYFAFDYSISDAVDDLTNEGSYVLFAMVDEENGVNFQKYERYPLENFKSKNYFDTTISNDGNVDFEIEVIDDDTYHVRGKMGDSSKVWFAEGCDPDLYIEWDLIIHRNYGWYGQHDIQNIAKSVGLIHWNTYAHDSEVEGYIIVGDTTYVIELNEDFRAYCDMNWGENFPEGNPSIDFPWGWYHVNVPDADPSQDLSIIAGIGRHNLATALETGGNPTELSVPGMGRFADIRLNGDTHIGVRSVILSPESVQDDKTPGLVTTNDGYVTTFEVERDNWVEFSDSIGSAEIPLNQKVTIETEHYKTVMNYFSEIGDYNRLLFPHERYIFSDFEALGVDVHVVISSITEKTTYKWYDLFRLYPIKKKTYTTIRDFWSDDGGLEYGYNVND